MKKHNCITNFKVLISHIISSNKMEQRVFTVLHYTETQSIAAVQNAFRARFPGRNLPFKSTILSNVRKYLNATSLNLNKGNSGRRRTTRSAGNIAAVRALLQQNPRDVSARRNPVAISSSGFNRITRLDLRWHPAVSHAPRRLHFSEWFNQRCRHQKFWESLIIGDEAAFAMLLQR